VRRGLLFGDVVFYLAVYGYCLSHWRPEGLYIVEMILAAIAFVLWITARVQLGASFTARAEAKELVTTGLYSKFSNPIYLFSTLAIFAMCLAMQWYVFGVAYTGIVTLIQLCRAKTERSALEAKYGERYREYRAGCWF